MTRDNEPSGYPQETDDSGNQPRRLRLLTTCSRSQSLPPSGKESASSRTKDEPAAEIVPNSQPSAYAREQFARASAGWLPDTMRSRRSAEREGGRIPASQRHKSEASKSSVTRTDHALRVLDLWPASHKRRGRVSRSASVADGDHRDVVGLLRACSVPPHGLEHAKRRFTRASAR
jgi:hypothetical protein